MSEKMKKVMKCMGVVFLCLLIMSVVLLSSSSFWHHCPARLPNWFYLFWGTISVLFVLLRIIGKSDIYSLCALFVAIGICWGYVVVYITNECAGYQIGVEEEMIDDTATTPEMQNQVQHEKVSVRFFTQSNDGKGGLK